MSQKCIAPLPFDADMQSGVIAVAHGECVCFAIACGSWMPEYENNA